MTGLTQVAWKAGGRLAVNRAWEQIWLDKAFFGLRCPLEERMSVPMAKIPVQMKALRPDFERELESELASARGADAIEVYARQGLCHAGVPGGYETEGPDGRPAYVQWLITPDLQDHLHRAQPGRYPLLGPTEALVEAAYTFAAWRGQGVMAPAMAQLVEMARERGMTSVLTYVAVDNVPSLRGCARAGFRPDHLRLNTRRLLQMSTCFQREIPGSYRALWDAAVGPRAMKQAA